MGDIFEITPLQMALDKGYKNVAEVLIDAEAKPNRLANSQE